MAAELHTRLRWTLVFFLLGVGAFLGYMLRWEIRAGKVSYYQLENFAKVLSYVQNHYVDEVNSDQLIRGAIRGMLSELDPHSVYFTPDRFQSFREETAGQFGGIGIEVTLLDGAITVVAPIEDSPAWNVGIKSGDQIIEVNGKSLKNLSLAEAIKLMQGKVGTSVSVRLYRPSTGDRFSHQIQREQISLKSVRSKSLEDGIYYMRITSFMERTGDDLAKALDSAKAAGNVRGVILDLRGNPGGLLDQAVKVSNLFLDDGPIVYTIPRDHDRMEVESARKGVRRTEAPLVILIDESSASASEIVAGALQDHGRAVVVGKTSFGKGSVQNLIPLGDGSGLKLTISRYYTPTGRSIQAKGIVPDVELENIEYEVVERAKQQSAEQVKEQDIEGHLIGTDEHTQTKAGGSGSQVLQAEWEKRLTKDYIVQQALGILKTIALVKSPLKKPEFQPDRASDSRTSTEQ